ncbi:hypothetical protein E2C01_010788 [Portunus trituberculatus]|uniref:Uncharacterized protein n=1 Tax=Portunus trituberculatus TaxID=210409 RepID=A0A5B7D9C0_PORTR|nr:hypothetical protein [Portunus trituberculatus]
MDNHENSYERQIQNVKANTRDPVDPASRTTAWVLSCTPRATETWSRELVVCPALLSGQKLIYHFHIDVEIFTHMSLQRHGDMAFGDDVPCPHTIGMVLVRHPLKAKSTSTEWLSLILTLQSVSKSQAYLAKQQKPPSAYTLLPGGINVLIRAITVTAAPSLLFTASATSPPRHHHHPFHYQYSRLLDRTSSIFHPLPPHPLLLLH